MEKLLDAVGKLCPIPLEEAKIEIETINSGDLLRIDFDCPEATENLPRWAAESGHEVTNFDTISEGVWTVSIKKK
ncbi:MAG: sulfurtransferase TusA family protein [Defluviitaleaceae bacterium]|nr:sulfurtransferase TusA family protein [Defluviitaleaceae bacterium]